MSVMRIKLVQGGIVDSADCVERLNFNDLTAQESWSITVNFGDGDVCIAEVIWATSAAYALHVAWDDSTSPLCRKLSHRCIVPGVLGMLSELFRYDIIHHKHTVQPVVTVAPIG